MRASCLNILSAAIQGLKLNVFAPTCRLDLSDAQAALSLAQHATLDAVNRAHHDCVLALSPGCHPSVLQAQSAWRQWLAHRSVIWVEQQRSLGDMLAQAATPLLAGLAPNGNLLINCQTTRESGIGSSPAGRLLSLAAKQGLGFTIGQSGLAGVIQALECALVLGRSPPLTGSVLVCAGERWIDIYPRVLGNWALLSDGAAAAAFSLSGSVEPTLWLMNERVLAHELGRNTACPSASSPIYLALFERLCAFIETLGIRHAGGLALATPAIALGRTLNAALAARYRFIQLDAVTHRPHFGAANALFNLQRLRLDDTAIAPAAYLVWDCDPSGLFGALALARHAFDPSGQGDFDAAHL